MTKIIEDPNGLLLSFISTYGTCDAGTFARLIAKHTSEVAIAVTSEGIAAQAIAWASSHNEFHYDPIDIDIDGDRYVAIQNTLIQALDVEAIVQLVEKKWDANSSTTAEAIQEALFTIHTESTILNLVSSATSQYKTTGENNG